MLFNYAVGVALSARAVNRPPHTHARIQPAKAILIAGIAANLGLLGYYKYANFFVANLNALFGSSLVLETIILPLAISFFTFQQIAYLVDAYRGETHEYSFLHYALFVVFFPQLIAGPIVHHHEILPQFARSTLYRLKAEHLAVGLTIFALGLFKKVVLADGVAIYATPVFDAAQAGTALTFFEAWGGALAYTFQLYFDFSGYSDMAIGLARMFGVRLPLNFNSPYQSTSIIDFWRRWHITLSRFLRDYLYIPLGGSRKGEARRLTNLLITMLLGGLWHGAGWTFVLWGGLHGFYLVVNHAWRQRRTRRGHTQSSRLGRFFGWLLTMLAVVIAWVPFRAEGMTATQNMLGAMFGFNGIGIPGSLAIMTGIPQSWLESLGFILGGTVRNGLANWSSGIYWISLTGLVAFVMPNTQQIMLRYRPALETYKGKVNKSKRAWLEWRLSTPNAILISFLFFFQ
jgi:alginate O-acetyltransferase complex protein AlgI